MRVLVCGSRDFTDKRAIWMVLSGISWISERVTLIEGGAAGADRIAAEYAEGIVSGSASGSHWKHEQYKAEWAKYGKTAGRIRNKQMLTEGKPDMVLAFVNKPLAESKGTADMVLQATQADIPTYVIRSMQES